MNWKLAGYEIQQGEDGKYYWGTYLKEGTDNDDKPWSCFTGRTWLEEDTLIMSPWKVANHAPDELQTEEEIDKHFESLPLWDRTQYYVKLADIGMSGLMVCSTNEPASDSVADFIMPKLGFVKSA